MGKVEKNPKWPNEKVARIKFLKKNRFQKGKEREQVRFETRSPFDCGEAAAAAADVECLMSQQHNQAARQLLSERVHEGMALTHSLHKYMGGACLAALSGYTPSLDEDDSQSDCTTATLAVPCVINVRTARSRARALRHSFITHTRMPGFSGKVVQVRFLIDSGKSITKYCPPST